MNKPMNQTIWIDPIQPNYFRIPDDQFLPAGDCLIYALTGRQQQVDPSALAAFSITEETAKTYLQVELEQIFAHAKNVVGDILNFAGMMGQHADQAQPATSEQFKPNLALLAALLHTTPEQARTDPTVITQGVRDLINEVQAVIDTATADDPAQRAAAQDRLRFLRTRLQAEGCDIGATLESMVEKLSAVAQLGQQQRTGDIASLLRQVADKLEQSPEEVGQRIDEAIASFEQQFGRLFVQESSEQRQERKRQEYRQSAQTAIAASLRAHGIKPASISDPDTETDHENK